MPRKHQRRHANPVRSHVEGEPEKPAGFLAPAVSRQESPLEQSIDGWRRTSQPRFHRRPVHMCGEPERPARRRLQLMPPRAFAEAAPDTRLRREFAKKPVDVPQVAK